MQLVVFHCIFRGEPRDADSFFLVRNLDAGREMFGVSM